MILTCPACATQYTVKDGAIPPGGRTVRCAACKHKWHQDDDGAAPNEAALAGGPPQPDPDQAREEPLADIPAAAAADDMVGEEPVPVVKQIIEDGRGYDEGYAAPSDDGQVIDQEQDFGAIGQMHEDEYDAPRRSVLPWIAGLVLLVVLAAAAFWFLAPEALKARAGIAGTGATPLQLMLTTSDRQKLASGNELLAISGRIINPTDNEQAVPPIEAELRNKASKKLVWKWTIPAPARSLPPRGSAPFNSAEVDIPQGGDELTVTLRGQAS